MSDYSDSVDHNGLLQELEVVHLPRAFRLNAIESLPKDNQERREPSKESSWQKAGR